MKFQQTPKLNLAARFINSTGSHVFLTGKAGTGKTTFLRQIADRTHKSVLIVAPTGIAALNAGGVTIHSQFLLPFGSFIPDREMPGDVWEGIPIFNRSTLTRKHPLNSTRKKVLRATELLIIDEVSMLRADILDAIDYRLRRAKGDYSRSFGGTQLLMIGDLQQLPPIVNEREWSVLRRFYPSMHFFEATALRREKMVSIELDRIFRQEEDRFIHVLNRLRDNKSTAEDISLLNSHYRERPPKSNREGVGADDSGTDEEPIIITTHNRTADGINAERMESLPGHSHYFEAEIDGDFPEKLYPLPSRIELKKGAQIMFIRNDSSEEKAYVNGSLARVLGIEEDEVKVYLRDNGREYILKHEKWENKNYTFNEERNEVDEEIIGTFSQYPVKLAWAVTVHRSQGLTFDKAEIDVGKAFAPGQVYVALSRLRSLEGLVLRTRIDSSCIRSDTEVKSFTAGMSDQESLKEILKEEQRLYIERYLSGIFDYSLLQRQLGNLNKYKGSKMEFEDEEMRLAMGSLEERVSSERKNTVLFRNQLKGLLHSGNREFLMQRIRSGRDYYKAFMEENLERIIVHSAEVEQLTRTKTYRNALGEIEQQIMSLLGALEGIENLVGCLLAGKDPGNNGHKAGTHVSRRNQLWAKARKDASENPKFNNLKSGRKRKKGAKIEKGASARLTWSMLKEGMSVRDIVEKRDLVRSTIEGHIVKGITEGKVDITTVMKKERIEEISGLLTKSNTSLGEFYKMNQGTFSYGEVRMVRAMMDRAGSET